MQLMVNNVSLEDRITRYHYVICYQEHDAFSVIRIIFSGIDYNIATTV